VLNHNFFSNFYENQIGGIFGGLAQKKMLTQSLNIVREKNYVFSKK